VSLSRVMRPTYPLAESLEWYIDNEHGVGRLLDLGPVLPRFDAPTPGPQPSWIRIRICRCTASVEGF